VKVREQKTKNWQLTTTQARTHVHTLFPINPMNNEDTNHPENDSRNAKRETPNAERPPSLIHLSDVKKVFLTDEVETHALDGIYLDIHPGEYVAIAGPSGCGKSTLLSILGLLDSPSGGQYLLNGRQVESLSFAERARIRNREIGFIFQSFNLIGDLTVLENVELPLTYRSEVSGAERKRRAIESLERVGMQHRQKHFPNQLSGGQQQRVAVARALAGSPSVLLADEPTGNLDSKNGDAVMELLADLHKSGATICMVTHDSRFAGYAERTIHLFDGKVVEDKERERQLEEELRT
jgi:putative ABC transport system ATP-binding protein